MRKIDYITKLMDISTGDEKEDINVRIAQVILKNLKNLGHMQNKEIAKLSYVDESTISRFVRSLGFVNYGEFKSYFREYNEVHNEHYYFHIDRFPSNQELLTSTIQALRNTHEMIKEEDILRVVSLINEYDEILLGGDRYSQLVAQDFQMKLLSLYKYVKTYEDILLQMNHLKKYKGLFILFTASYSKSKMITALAKQQGWKVVIITRNKEALKDGDACIIYDDKEISDWTTHSVNDRFCMQLIVDQMILKIASSAIFEK